MKDIDPAHPQLKWVVKGFFTLTGLSLIALVLHLIDVWPLRSAAVESMSAVAIRGAFGDSFGAVNSIFSLLTVAGLAGSFYVQSKIYQDESASKVLENQARERSKIEDDNSRDKSQFESSFYSVLNLFISTREAWVARELRLGGEAKVVEFYGRTAALNAFKRYSNSINVYMAKEPQTSFDMPKLLEDFDYSEHISNPATYRQTFLLLKTLLKLTKAFHEKFPLNSVHYFEILKAILSDRELYLMIYWIIGTRDEEFSVLLNEVSLTPDFNRPPMEMSELLLKNVREAFLGQL